MLWLALVIAVALGTQPFIVRAHADYERSDPAADAVIDSAPAQLQVWFNQELFRREGANELAVFGPDEAQVDLGDTEVDDEDRTLMRVSLSPDLPNGTYRVVWRSLSADDGHPGEGAFVFHVGAASATERMATEDDTGHDDHGAHGSVSTASVQPEVTVAAPQTPLLTATVAVPTIASTAAPTAESSGGSLPCMGGSALALLAVGTVLVGRRRHRQV